MKIEKQFDDFCQRYKILKKKSVLAVSGGADSVVLLDLFAKKVPKKNFLVAHIDHGLRAESGKDQEFVSRLAKKYGVGFFSEKLDLKSRDEATARENRYRALRGIKKSQNADFIITAHHLNDQAETIIFRLVRGSGPLTLWGMKERSGDILRPLLDISKEEILNYAKSHRIKYLEDPTNKSLNYARNRIRHKVIPELLKINPGFLYVIKENAKLGREMAAVLEKEIGADTDNEVDISKLKKMPAFFQKALVKKKLEEILPEREVSRKNVEEVISLINKKGSKQTEIGGKIILKDGGALYFDYISEDLPQETKEINIGQEIVFGDMVLRSYFGKGTSQKNNILLPRRFSDNLKVRTWHCGDKIETRAGTKKIQDIFIDAKVSKKDRSRWPLVFSGEKIVWVPGLQASKYAKKRGESLILEFRRRVNEVRKKKR